MVSISIRYIITINDELLEVIFSQVANLTVGKKLPHGTEITVNCRENYEVSDENNDDDDDDQNDGM